MAALSTIQIPPQRKVEGRNLVSPLNPPLENEETGKGGWIPTFVGMVIKGKKPEWIEGVDRFQTCPYNGSDDEILKPLNL